MQIKHNPSELISGIIGLTGAGTRAASSAARRSQAARTSSDPGIATCTCSILPDSRGRAGSLRQPAAPGAGTPMGLG